MGFDMCASGVCGMKKGMHVVMVIHVHTYIVKKKARCAPIIPLLLSEDVKRNEIYRNFMYISFMK